MNSVWDIHIFLGLVPKELPCSSNGNGEGNIFCEIWYPDIGVAKNLSLWMWWFVGGWVLFYVSEGLSIFDWKIQVLDTEN